MNDWNPAPGEKVIGNLIFDHHSTLCIFCQGPSFVRPPDDDRWLSTFDYNEQFIILDVEIARENTRNRYWYFVGIDPIPYLRQIKEFVPYDCNVV